MKLQNTVIAIKRLNKIDHTLKAPPSKSYLNRALIIAALARGKSRLENSIFCEDTNFMVQALRQFGISIKKYRDSLIIEGKGTGFKTPNQRIFVGNAGTTLRFLTSFSLLSRGKTILQGDARMNQRPVQDLLDSLSSLGIKISSQRNNGCPPIIIEGRGRFPGGKITLKGDKSSQYLSSLLLCAPYARKDTCIDIIGELISQPYLEMTLKVMRDFGIGVRRENYRSFYVKGGQEYKSRTYRIEGDASNASYFFAAAAITRGRIRITDLSLNSPQGDLEFLSILEKMGCRIRKEAQFMEVVGGNKLKGIALDMKNIPDLVPTLAITALFAQGKTRMNNIGHLRIKETDRIRALTHELRKIGAKVKEFADGLVIQPGHYRGAEIETYNDHRMAMSFAIAGLRISGIRIKNPACVNKSFPRFFKRLEELYQ